VCKSRIIESVTFACNKTNLMHYLSSVYSVTMPVHVLGMLFANHQEVTMYTVYATVGTCCMF
jgi:hypothetical protein